MIKLLVLLFEGVANFVELTIVSGRSLEINILKAARGKVVIEELTVLCQIYGRVAEYYSDAKVLKTFAVSYLLEIKGATLQHSLYPVN